MSCKWNLSYRVINYALTIGLPQCTILPSAVAFTSLISAAGVPSTAAFGLCFGRFFLTPKHFPKARWSLGKWSKPMQ